MVAGMPVHVLDEYIIKTAYIEFSELSRQPVILAENEQKSSNGVSKPQNTSNEQPIDSQGTVKEKKGNPETETSKKSLKPFKPSEEIAAEQAVDFPWDI
jgi:hypothetical protein